MNWGKDNSGFQLQDKTRTFQNINLILKAQKIIFKKRRQIVF